MANVRKLQIEITKYMKTAEINPSETTAATGVKPPSTWAVTVFAKRVLLLE